MSSSSLHPVFTTRLTLDVFGAVDGQAAAVALSAIREKTGANPSTLSRAVNTLEAAGYLTVARRGRRAFLAPTARGSDAYARYSPMRSTE
jgi:DNA-binding IclR family transcriptional regulator